MSELKTKPVLKCKRCGNTYTTSIRTTVPDDDGALLQKIFQMVAANGLCPRCDEKKAWYYSQGRSEEWEKGV